MPEYDVRHIPGARFVSLNDISVSDHSGKGLTLEMPPAADLRARLADLGISDHSRIITGHIAGAHSVPSTSVTDDQLKVRSAEELAAIFAKAGVQPDDTVIAYCHIGQQATVVLFAARTLGHPVLLYDGSFEDWSRHPNYPVENPAKQDGGR